MELRRYFINHLKTALSERNRLEKQSQKGPGDENNIGNVHYLRKQTRSGIGICGCIGRNIHGDQPTVFRFNSVCLGHMCVVALPWNINTYSVVKRWKKNLAVN
jgi:hypothetical protein